jgi:hypothetical protein
LRRTSRRALLSATSNSHARRLQYLNDNVQIANQNDLHHQHVDHKIANALLKRGTGPDDVLFIGTRFSNLYT